MSSTALPEALIALASLKTGPIGFGEAGERIRLSLTQSKRLAMIGVTSLWGSRKPRFVAEIGEPLLSG
jgi:hypothetical protein